MVSSQYLAGFIDGEGYVSLGKIPRRGRSTEFPLRVVVYNTNQELLKEIQKAWGGTLSDSGVRNPRWKPGYALIWTNAAASLLLASVALFLRVKSVQAAELLKFHEHVRKCRRVRDRNGRLLPLTKSEQRFRELYHERLKVLNARGPKLMDPSESTRSDSSLALNTVPSIEYLAGFVDGEGSLMISKWRGQGSHPQYRPRISVSNTNRFVLEDVKRACGGILASQPAPEAEWKNSFQLIWSNGMVGRLLVELMPHLRLKRTQAAVMIDFIHHQARTPRQRQGANGRFFAPLSDDVLAYREALYQRMKALNAKGPSPSSARPVHT